MSTDPRDEHPVNHVAFEAMALAAYHRAPCETRRAVVYVPKKPGETIASVRCGTSLHEHVVTVAGDSSAAILEVRIGGANPRG